VFRMRYKLNFYVIFRRISVFNGFFVSDFVNDIQYILSCLQNYENVKVFCETLDLSFFLKGSDDGV
jgi:hypothetical protein